MQVLSDPWQAVDVPGLCEGALANSAPTVFQYTLFVRIASQANILESCTNPQAIGR